MSMQVYEAQPNVNKSSEQAGIWSYVCAKAVTHAPVPYITIMIPHDYNTLANIIVTVYVYRAIYTGAFRIQHLSI